MNEGHKIKTHLPFIVIQTLLFSFIRIYGKTFTTNCITYSDFVD